MTYWSYNDALIQTYVLPYLRIIRNLIGPSPMITLVTVERSDFPTRLSSVDGVINTFSLRLKYSRFGVFAILRWFYNFVHLLIYSRRSGVSVIHAWCTPAGSIGFFLSLFLRKPLVLDSFEPHADSMLENGTWRRSGLAYRLLLSLEKKQAHYASTIIAAAPGMIEYARTRYDLIDKHMYVKPACVDLKQFDVCFNKPVVRRRLGLPEGCLVVYAGKFGGIYFESEVIRFVSYLRSNCFPDLSFLVLSTTSVGVLHSWCVQYDFPIDKLISKFVPHGDISHYISAADFALSPVKPVASKRYCSPIKNGEYWACGLPVVISPNISIDSEQIEGFGIGVVCNFNDVACYKTSATQLKLLLAEPCTQLHVRIRKHATIYRNYKIAEDVYRCIYRGGEL